MRYGRFVALRLAGIAILVAALAVLTFFATRIVADPVRLILGVNATPESERVLNHALGLDQSLWAQFTAYLESLLHGDLGQSIWLQEPASDLILERLPATLLLATCGMALGLVIGVLFGVMGGLRPRSLWDRLTTLGSAAAVAVPDFWLALLLIIIFSVQLGWFPTGGYAGLDPQTLFLPVITVALLPAGRIARITREAVIVESSKPYVTSARARGLSVSAVMRRHVLRNIAGSAGTVAGYDFLLILTGSIASVEVVFNWPGIGRLAIQAATQQDVTLLSALVIVTGLIIGFGNLLIGLLLDALNGWREVTS